MPGWVSPRRKPESYVRGSRLELPDSGPGVSTEKVGDLREALYQFLDIKPPEGTIRDNALTGVREVYVRQAWMPMFKVQ